MMTNSRIHKNAQFQYQSTVSTKVYTVTVRDIAIVTNGETTEVKIYFNNDGSKNDELHCMSPEDFHNKLNGVNAMQTA